MMPAHDLHKLKTVTQRREGACNPGAAQPKYLRRTTTTRGFGRPMITMALGSARAAALHLFVRSAYDELSSL